jgi:hypothetical protein
VLNQSLLNSSSKSCGCLHREAAAAANRTHGQSNSDEYGIWVHLLSRCFNRNDDRYDRYGGRGIAVCERWLKFENFIADMGPRPSHAHSIDRIDNDGHYEPSNCRWATPERQQRNTARTMRVTFRGETLALSDWSERLGIASATLFCRIRRGWTAERALTLPVQKKGDAHASL